MDTYHSTEELTRILEGLSLYPQFHDFSPPPQSNLMLWFIVPFFFFFNKKIDFILRAILGLEQNWELSAGISHLPPDPCVHSLPKYQCSHQSTRYRWWADGDMPSPRVPLHVRTDSSIIQSEGCAGCVMTCVRRCDACSVVSQPQQSPVLCSSLPPLSSPATPHLITMLCSWNHIVHLSLPFHLRQPLIFLQCCVVGIIRVCSFFRLTSLT